MNGYILLFASNTFQGLLTEERAFDEELFVHPLVKTIMGSFYKSLGRVTIAFKLTTPYIIMQGKFQTLNRQKWLSLQKMQPLCFNDASEKDWKEIKNTVAGPVMVSAFSIQLPPKSTVCLTKLIKFMILSFANELSALQ